MKDRPFKKFFCDRMEVFQLPHPAFKVWMYHYKCEQKDRKSWPSIETIAEDCQMDKKTVVSQRKWLLENGWLERLGEKQSNAGRFGVVEFRVKRGTIPNKRVTAPQPNKRVAVRTQEMGRGPYPLDGLGSRLSTEVDQIEVEDSQMSLKNNITISCRKILKVRLQINDPAWSELKTLAQIHGAAVVESAFEQWAENLEDKPAHPLTAFANKADTILADEEQELQTDKGLIRELAEISGGRIRFNKKYAAEVSQFLKEFTADEIKSAFSDFVSTVREDKLEWAAKDFAETADQLIIPMRNDRKKLEMAAEAIARIENTPVLIPDEPEPFEL